MWCTVPFDIHVQRTQNTVKQAAMETDQRQFPNSTYEISDISYVSVKFSNLMRFNALIFVFFLHLPIFI